MSEQHARLSPSNHRWVYCPGSIREESKYPDISGEAAIDGTGSHLLLERCLQDNRDASFYLYKSHGPLGLNHPDKRSGWKVDKERADRVQTCLDYIERRKKELSEQFPKSTISVQTEMKTNPGEIYYRDDWWGTVDITLIVKQNFLNLPVFIEVIDFKDGRGFVNSKDNPQLIAYLGGQVYKHATFKSIKCRMTIVQPKTNPPVRYENIEPEKLKEKLNQLAEAAKLTDDPNASLTLDNKGGKGYCKWCKHRNNCEARKDQLIGDMKMFTEQTETKGMSLFESIEQTFKDVTTMDDETLSQMLDAKSVIEDVFKRAEEEAQTRLKNGGYVPGYAMLPGNSSKKWKIDEEELVKKLRACKLKKDEVYIQKIISPAQVLKHPTLTKRQKDRIEKDFIDVVPGALKLKPISRQNREKEIVDKFKEDVLQCNTKKWSFL